MKEKHLNEDQIIVSAVDEDDLPENVKSHLKTCPLCQEERRILMSQLEEMGGMAKDLAPRPKAEPLVYPKPWGPKPWGPKPWDAGAWRRIFFRWPVFASGLACFLILAGIWGLMLLQGPQGKPQVRMASDSSAEQSVAGVVFIEDLLEESVLPEYYLDIAVASPEDFDDEFLEFVVPVEEADDSA